MFVIAIRLLAIFLMMGVGWQARRRGLVGDEACRSLARLQTAFIYPALIFTAVTGNFTLSSLTVSWQLPVGAFAIMATGFVAGLLMGRFFTNPHSPQGHAFLFQCSINNYSFLPMPLALLFWGQEGVARLILSTLGSELAVWTLGVYAMSGRRLDIRNLRRLVNPPLIAVGVAVAFILLRDGTGWLDHASSIGWLRDMGTAMFSTMALFGGATIPLAMVVAGARMAALRPHHLFTRLQGGVVLMRLAVVPALCVAWLQWWPMPDGLRQVLVLVAVMPSSLASVILSELYGADSEFAATSILTTHALALFTIPLWLALT